MFQTLRVVARSLARSTCLQPKPQLQLRHASSSGATEVLRVPERAYLKLSGKDAKTFLQGVTTNDMALLKGRGDCLATVFLTPKGRVLSDAILYDITAATEPDAASVPTVLVETHLSTHAAVAQFLSMYRLRAKVAIHTATDYRTDVALSVTGAVAAAAAAVADTAAAGETLLANVQDPRHASLGRRLLYHTPAPSPAAAAAEGGADEALLRYTRYRLLHGLAEGAELEGRVPLEGNLDLLRYISFTKGCYVGQELVARTKHKGMVRKRFVPFIRTADVRESAEFLELDPLVERALRTARPSSAPVSHGRALHSLQRGSSMALRGAADAAGKVGGEEESAGEVVAVSSVGDIGIAKVSLKNVYGGSCFSAVSGAGVELPVRLCKPRWWPEVDGVTGKRIDDPTTF